MKRLLITTLLLQMAAPMLPAFAGTMEEAVADYNARKYGDCVEKCQKVLIAGKSDKAHYYMALAYQGLAQIKPAKSEYLWVYSNAKDYNLKRNAWVALQGLDRYSSKRAVEGNGNDFNRASPPNTKAVEVANARAAQQAADEAADAAAMAVVRRSGGGCRKGGCR